jgi:HSP20 family protein
MATVPVPVKQPAANLTSMSPDVWRSLRSEMDRLFDSFFTGRFGASPFLSIRFDTPLAVPSPAVDITEEEGAFKVTAEVPGMTEKDIQVSVAGDTLTIKGENRYLAERSYGEFERAFLVPDNVDHDKVAASFANGVLTISLPKVAKTPPKTIEVKAAA